MEFCSDCKSLMVPKVMGTKKVLICRGCGKKKKKLKVGEYKISEAPLNRHGDVPIIEEDNKKDLEEERRYMGDLYGFGGDSDFED